MLSVSYDDAMKLASDEKMRNDFFSKLMKKKDNSNFMMDTVHEGTFEEETVSEDDVIDLPDSIFPRE
jgi:hypothetical protein